MNALKSLTFFALILTVVGLPRPLGCRKWGRAFGCRGGRGFPATFQVPDEREVPGDRVKKQKLYNMLNGKSRYGNEALAVPGGLYEEPGKAHMGRRELYK
ncbi:hypothetical protein ACROYT_G023843 [Oculina patagonica]